MCRTAHIAMQYVPSGRAKQAVRPCRRGRLGRRQGHGGAKKRPRQPGKTQLAGRQSEKNRHFLFTSPQPRRVLTARPDAARRQREASFSAEHLLDVVQRAALHLLVNLADVSPHHAH